MEWLARGMEEFSVLWVFVGGVTGGLVGAAIKFAFEGVLQPQYMWKRDARRLVKLYLVPLARTTESLERAINGFVRNIDKNWYRDSEYFKLSTLYAFGEYLGWVRAIERKFGFTVVGSSRRGNRFNIRLNGFYRAMSSHTYFSNNMDSDAVDASQVPRKMFSAIGEVMSAGDSEPARMLDFSEFCVRYRNDAQFARWFQDLDYFLSSVTPNRDPVPRWDRLIAAGANLRVLAAELEPSRRARSRARMVNLEKIENLSVRQRLQKDFPAYVPSALREP